MILGELFERNAACFGNRPCVWFEDRWRTHGEVTSRVRRLINALAKLGGRKQDRLVVLARNCPEYLEVYGAAALGGFVGVGINYRLSLDELADIVRDAEPAFLFFEPEYAQYARQLQSACPQTQLIAFGAVTDGALSYEALLDAASDGPIAFRAVEEDTLYLVYTSGTTGKPKGVMLGNGSVAHQTFVLSGTHCAEPTDRMLIVMPFYHMGAPAESFAYLATGAAIVMHRAFDVEEAMRSIESQRVTAALLAPTMIQMLLDAPARNRFDLTTLQTICYASAPMSVALLRRAHAAFGPIFMQVYGMSELGLGCAMAKFQHVFDGSPAEVKRLASAGQPFLGTQIRIVDDSDAPCPSGTVGNILIRSTATVMQGYWRQPERTKEAIRSDGFLVTGDVGYLDEDSFLFIVDRKKDMIISGGENIYSREVEDAIAMHPAVAEVAVIGAPHPKWGETVVAVIVLNKGMRVSEDELNDHVRAHIASYKKPSIYRFIDRLPRVSSTNKVDKRALREPFWAGHERQV